ARGCIGEHFAMLEATIILAEVARRWTISPAGDAPEPEFRVTLRPTPAVPLRLQRRAPH
nr:cytochrome P450 [Ilumatobacteraceae bacterium]